MILYLSQDDVDGFLTSGRLMAPEAVAQEWEGEAVVHLHLAPPLHGYGLRHAACFVRQECSWEQVPAGVDYVVRCREQTPAEAFGRTPTGWQALAVQRLPARAELYSRSEGLLEVDALVQKRVMIVGLGSFGSQIALELAKAGVGAFSLWDFDRLEPHNLARHTASLQDLGRLKTDILFSAIRGKNPYAVIDRFPFNVADCLPLMAEEVAKADLVLCATDNNASRMHLSSALLEAGTPALFGRAFTRAAGGDVFRYRPEGPCYCCLIGNDWFAQGDEEITHRRDPRIPAYAEDPDAFVQVGLSADIEPICNLMVKLALVELSRGTVGALTDLDAELPYEYYLWANRREARYRNWLPFPKAAGKPTILRWYGARIARDDTCALCAPVLAELDLGDNLPNFSLGEVSSLLLPSERPASKTETPACGETGFSG